MAKTRNGGEALSPEAAAEVEIMTEIDRLFKEMDGSDAGEERKAEIAGEIRAALKRYHQIFGPEVKDMIDAYYQRLEKSQEGKG